MHKSYWPICVVFMWVSALDVVHFVAGEIVDMYIPRKCSATNRLISAKDHSSIQINLGEVDETGRYTGTSKVYAIAGTVRTRGESDDCINQLCDRDGISTKGVLSWVWTIVWYQEQAAQDSSETLVWLLGDSDE